MDEIWVRLGLVVGVLAVAGCVILIQRARARRPIRTVEVAGKAPGVYFFSSSTCATCEQARDKLDARLGTNGYTEYAWEDDPGPFGDFDVDAVPAVVILEEGGRGRLYPGQPDRALSRLGGISPPRRER